MDMADEAGLDLVEISPNASPPVCKIMDYGKWKYAQRKKEQKAKSHAKQSELKGMRLRPKIDSHDLGIKVAKARTFLEDGDKGQFTMLFRGRGMAHQDLGMKTMREVFDTLQDVAKVEAMPKMQGRRMTMLLTLPDGREVSLSGISSSSYVTSGFKNAINANRQPNVKIIYDPKNPRNYVFEKEFGSHHSGYFTAVYSALGLLFSLFLIKFGFSSLTTKDERYG